MPVQSLTYAELAERWGISKEAARKKVEGLRLPRRIGNDGKARVQVDLDEVTHRPKAPSFPDGDQPETTPGDPPEAVRPPPPEVQLLQDRVAELRLDLERERLERLQERERSDRLTVELTETGHRLVALMEELRDLEALRERLANADRQHSEASERHALELRKAHDEWRTLSWWRRLAG